MVQTLKQIYTYLHTVCFENKTVLSKKIYSTIVCINLTEIN